ncbi:MAG: calcium-binding protein [Microcystis sp. LE19-114.1B]|jgi:serralysin|nr:calcium-binding protein [Microcystis sp. LE19-114.1B]
MPIVTGNGLDNIITPSSASAGVTGWYGGLWGDDTIDGGAGADDMNGGDGNDTYHVDNVGDIVREDWDDVSGGTADTVLATVTYSIGPGTFRNQGHGIENLTLMGSANINATGNSKNNILNGNSGNNVLNGGDGNDKLFGGAGDDLIDGGLGFDTIDGGLGNDTTSYAFYGGPINANLATGVVSFPGNSLLTDTLVSIENLIGTAGNDTIIGNIADNSLNGGAGNDSINGGDGVDTLIGGAGNDTLTGGAGADKFRFNFLSEKVDTIQDFFRPQGDKIEVSASGFGATSLSQISYNAGSGSLSFLGTEFAKIANLPAGFAVSLDVVLI